MATDEIIYLELNDAFWLHLDLMKDWNENRCGVDHRSLVESALARPKHAAIYENADIIRQAGNALFRTDKKSSVARRKQTHGNAFNRSVS